MNRSEWRELLIRWANIHSGSDHLAGLTRMAAALAEEFKKVPGARVDEIALAGTTAKVLRVRSGSWARAGRKILLRGHYDTVYGPEHSFQSCTQIDADILRGPGVADMKGGIAVALMALTTFEGSPDAAKLRWEVLLGPDEEIGSPWSRPLWDEAAHRHRLGLVFEPARENGKLVAARKGTGIFQITCRGRAAHAGRDAAAGRNAIVALAELLPRVDALNRELPGVMVNIGRVTGGGAVNIVPDFAMAEVNIRIARAADEALVRGRLGDLAEAVNARDGYTLEVAGRFNRPPKEVSELERNYFAHWQTCGRELGVELDWQNVDGGSDGNLLSAAGLPVLDGLGPRGGRMHSVEEYVSLASLEERAAVAARFLGRYARGEAGPELD